ncbi:MAG: LysR family transcriptional regulator [Sulfitobacter sp.]
MTITATDLNLRHLRAFSEVCQRGSISQAAQVVHLSQPAITHAIAGLEDQLRTKLFQRMPRGMAPTDLGARFHLRVRRALLRLNDTMSRGTRTPKRNPLRVEARATSAQLRALLAIGETASYSAAARLMGTAQPTVYRAARDLEHGLGVTLFEKSANGVRLTREGELLQQDARLMFSELDQALQEINTDLGRGPAQIRVGALPLARATILSDAINQTFEGAMPLQVYVDDGPFPDLLQAVRRGSLDILLGALRDPPPFKDIVQETLFLDQLAVFCGPDHPLLGQTDIHVADLAGYPWILPRSNTPTRNSFEHAFPHLSKDISGSLVETSSMVLVRALLQSHQRLTLISKAQVETETRQGLVIELPITLNTPPRAIGILHRADWYPTAEQEGFLSALRRAGSRM